MIQQRGDQSPKKRVGAGALFFNEEGEILIVKPTYMDGWNLPGGEVEADESPKAACQREIREELGSALPIGSLRAVDYTSADEVKDDSLQFVFDGGVLKPSVIAHLRFPAEELTAYRFVSLAEAREMVRPRLGKRLPQCLRARASGQTLYLHDGDAV